MPDDMHVPESRNEIAVRPRPELRAGAAVAPIIPRTIDEVFRVAQAVITAGLAPDSYTKERGSNLPDREVVSRVVVGIMKAAEVGLPPITGLSTIAIINGRPSLYGDGAVALIQASGKLERMTIEEIGPPPGGAAETAAFSDDFGVCVTMWRADQSTPYVGRFTVGDAKRAHLWMSTRRVPWIEHPRRMLKWRAFSQAASDGFSDCLMGLVLREVAEDLPIEAPAQTDISFLDDAPQPLNAPKIAAGEAAASEDPAVTTDEHEQHRPHPLAARPAEHAQTAPSPDPPVTGAIPPAGTDIEGHIEAIHPMQARRAAGSPDSGLEKATAREGANPSAGTNTETPATGIDQPIIGKERNTQVGALGQSPPERPSRVPGPIDPVMRGPGPRRMLDADATLKRLVGAFYELTTVAECDAFRVQNRSTVNMLPADEREAFAINSGDHERVLSGGEA